jgi:hypothetical protein
MAGLDSYVKLLLHMDGADASTTFTDSSASAHTMTAVGNAQIDTAYSKFGGASGIFDGTGDYVSTPDSTDFDFGTGDFTIDYWVRPTSSVENVAIYCQRDSDYSRYVVIRGNGGFDSWSFLAMSYSPVATYGITCAHSVGTWYHHEIVRNGSNLYWFVNGVAQTLSATVPISTTSMPDVGEALHLGGNAGWGEYLNGWLDELRISKGIARHTSNFTPPAYEYDANTTVDFTGIDGSLTLSGTGNVVATTLLDFTSIDGSLTLGGDGDVSAGSGLFIHGVLPIITGSITVSTIYIAISGTLPALTGTLSEQGNACEIVDIDLPVLTGSITVSVPNCSVIEGVLPLHTPVIYTLSGGKHSIAGTLPKPTVQLEAYVGQVFQISGTLPGITGSITEYGPYIHTISGTLPSLLGSISIADQIAQAIESFGCLVLNLSNMALTTYDGYNFNSLCEFEGQYFGANEEGLFLLEGATDAGRDIETDIVLGETDFDSSLLKRMSYAYLAMATNGGFTLSATNETNETTSQDVVDTKNDIHTAKVKLGRGYKGRYWTPRIQNKDGAEITLERIELIPDILSRRA